jgi:uncharacterized protein with FMN-binding domain
MPKRPFFALLIAGTALILVLSFKTPVETSTGSSSGQQVIPNDPSAMASGTTTSARSGTFTGNTIDTRYGPVQVQITLENGTITDVQALQAPSGDPRSSEISTYAIPKLVQATLQAQGAQVHTISGATSTSHAFIQSLQSALAQANG